VTSEVDSGVAELVPDRDRAGGWTLRLDGTPQSHVDLGEPGRIEFEYVRRLAHVVDLAAPAGTPSRVLHLGGGAMTLARYVAASRPRSSQVVVELDGALIELVRARLPIERTWRVRVRQGDARAVLATVQESAFDLVVTDVFAGGRTPAHLTSVEFVELVARALRPGGVYAANIGDGGPLTFARAQVATVRAVFPQVCVLGEASVLRGRRFGNLVLVAANGELPVAELSRRGASDPFPSRVEHGDGLTRFTGGAHPVTDATATRSPAPPRGVFGLQG
jgi:spermidine synthase